MALSAKQQLQRDLREAKISLDEAQHALKQIAAAVSARDVEKVSQDQADQMRLLEERLAGVSSASIVLGIKLGIRMVE